jgi:hypothetical protein
MRAIFFVFLLPDDFSDGGGTKGAPKRGARWFVALRCYDEECAITLSTQAQESAWDLAEYKRVEPAHCPTGATSGGGDERKLFVGIPPSLFYYAHATCPLHDWGVRN